MLWFRMAALSFVLLNCAWNAHAAEKPNFVWLLSEDNSKHFLKLFDEYGAETPNIEKLAQHGLIFNHAFSNSPVCSVARTTLNTGCFAPRIGTQFHRKSVTVPMPPGMRMFPAYLRNAGYYTTNNRKKDYNAVEGPGVWDASSNKATWRNRKKGQPFFHMQSFATSHESSLHFSQKKMENEKTNTDPDKVFIAPYHPKTPTFRYTYARYHDRIVEMDQQIGRVVSQIEKDGLLEDTFIFYFGDHGGVLPRGKGYAYESGLHVPLVVRVPDKWKHLVPAKIGSRIDGFVNFIDFGPTLLNLAGLTVPQQMDGRPFLGKDVSLKEINGRDETFGHADRFDEKYDLVRTLRKGKFKYIRNYQPFNFDGLHNNYRYKMLAFQEWRELFHVGKLNAIERQFFESRASEALYNLEVDPHETMNLAGNPAYEKILHGLRTNLTNRVKNLPDLSFYPESFLATGAFKNPVPYGKSHKSEIAALIDTADLALQPMNKVKSRLVKSLTSENPWQRYWALIACTSHGKNAKPFFDKAKQLAANDPERLVRVRAAEFLGLFGEVDPRPDLLDVLGKTTTDTETNLVLNTVVLLRDGQPGYQFEITADTFKSLTGDRYYVKRRLEDFQSR